MDKITFEEKNIVFYNRKKIAFIITLLVLLATTISIVITLGAYDISILTVYKVVLAHLKIGSQSNNLFNTIIWEIRIPRILVAIAVGTFA